MGIRDAVYEVIYIFYVFGKRGELRRFKKYRKSFGIPLRITLRSYNREGSTYKR